MNPGPDGQQSHGQEYPPLEDTPTPPEAYPAVDYPATTGQQPPAYPGSYPGSYDVPPGGFPYPGPPQDGGYPQGGHPPGGYPPPPIPGAPYQGYPGQQYPGAIPYGYDPYRQAQPTGTNGKAIASLVTSLVGLACCMLPGIIGIILGVMAMREIKQTGQEGHGMALAGVIIGGLALAFGAIGIVFVIIFGVLDSTSPYSSYSSY